MRIQLNDIVRFRSDLLFNGAVNVDWFLTDQSKRRAAAESFVFHGPKYHGVTQADVGATHGYHLQDTASFTRAVVKRSCGLEDQPFTMAIAGYGTGKSHLALTLAVLLSEPTGKSAEVVLSRAEAADKGIGGEIRAILHEHSQPGLVVVLNGMRNFDLTAEVTQQVVQQLRARKIDASPLDELRPRFLQAATLIRMSSEHVIRELLQACEVSSADALLETIEKQDEHVYVRVQEFFAAHGMPIRALGGESVRDVIQVVSREYCGKGKPFGRLVILFDEFGRYTEFATVRSHIAGSGVLQDLFEGVQANADTTCFFGFIQFELSAYVQRVAPEFKNDILRYVTRYQSASKAYLSINLETLIAHLLEKRKPEKLDDWFDTERMRQQSQGIADDLRQWFPLVSNHQLWSNPKQFHDVIRKGCWPLSPYSTWFLFHLAAAGKHLQERSALALLGDTFLRYGNALVAEDGTSSLAPVDLWSNDLQQELITSEEGGQQGSIAHAYSSVHARHGAHLSDNQLRILRGVVLASKMGLRVSAREEALRALAELTRLPSPTVRKEVGELQQEYNVLEWDEGFKAFDILGDAVPRTQFLAFIRQRVASSYDENGKAKLFAGKASDWCEPLGDRECDFAEQQRITTREWRYEGLTSNLDLLESHIKVGVNRWANAVAVDEARGTFIYCYVGQSQDPEVAMNDSRKLLRGMAREVGIAALPILIVLLCDEEGKLGQALAELAVLEESITEQDRARFGNLIGAHKEKMRQAIHSYVESMIKQRRYITCLQDQPEAERLSRVGTELFERVYPKPLAFPFDGFSTARGNAADSCQQLTIELLRGSLDYDAVIAKPVKVKNRAVTVLKDCWGVFTRAGAVSRRPTHPVVRRITELWDGILQSDRERFAIGDVLRQLFSPPYGANIASAGLLMGVFVAPRIEELAVIRDGQQYAVSQWLQDGVFKGKFLDLAAIQGVELAFVGTGSAEWENLFGEWEQAESYVDRVEFLQRANELKERIPVPPASSFRFFHLEEQARIAADALQTMKEARDEAFSKLDQGYAKDNVSTLSWGAVELLKLQERMTSEQPLWNKYQIEELQPYIERARETVIQIFPKWLSNQAPRGDSPELVGQFKHRMLHLVGGSLKKLKLDSQYQELETWTAELIRNAETAAEARQLIRDVRSWLSQHIDACRIVRVAELRGLREIGKQFTAKLQGMSRRIPMVEINEVRSELAGFLGKLKEAEESVTKRASRLLGSQLRSIEDLEGLLNEVETLTRAFEGCQRDLEDLHEIRGVLQTYQRYYRQLEDKSLTWREFESLTKKLQQEAEAKYGEKEEIPWAVDDTFTNFLDRISKERVRSSSAWIEAIECDALSVSTMSAPEANRLHIKASNPPAYLTNQHAKRLAEINQQIEARLESLAIDWLVEKFRDLPGPAKRKFLEIATQITEGITP